MGEIFTREQAKASDHTLYDLMFDAVRAQSMLAARMNSIHYAANDEYRRRYDSRSGWKLADQQAIDKVTAIVADEERPGYKRNEARTALEKYAAAFTARTLADEKVATQELEWNQHGQWPRYAIVPGGHIHKELGCHTFHYDSIGRRTTDVRWAYFVSGDTVEDAIEVYGEALCSHCYPNAPVAKTYATIAVDADGNPLTKAQSQEIKDARQAEKDAKATAKNAAAVIDPLTGKVIYKTDRAAKNEVLGAANDALSYEMDHPSMNEWHVTASRAIDGLVDKGTVADRAEFITEVATKAAKKRVRELKGWRDDFIVRQMIARGQEVTTPAYEGKTWQELAPLIEAWLA